LNLVREKILAAEPLLYTLSGLCQSTSDPLQGMGPKYREPIPGYSGDEEARGSLVDYAHGFQNPTSRIEN
jgi:hypothetical protein